MSKFITVICFNEQTHTIQDQLEVVRIPSNAQVIDKNSLVYVIRYYHQRARVALATLKENIDAT